MRINFVYMKKNKANEFISASKLSSLTGYTERWLRQIGATGYFPPPKDGRYKHDETLIGLFKLLRENKNMDERTERTLLLRARRLKLESEAGMKGGTYMKTSDFRETLAALVKDMQDGLKQRFQQVSPKLVGLDEPDIRATLDAVWNEVGNTLLSQALAKFAKGPETPVEPVHILVTSDVLLREHPELYPNPKEAYERQMKFAKAAGLDEIPAEPGSPLWEEQMKGPNAEKLKKVWQKWYDDGIRRNPLVNTPTEQS